MENRYHLTRGLSSVTFTYDNKTEKIKNHQTNEEYKIAKMEFDFFLRMMQNMGYKLQVESRMNRT